MDRFAFLTQVHQAIAIQVQTEHYRRWRGKLHPDGRGNTMCALYWQLNDVWAAPSWSSIDFDFNWKALHYFARRFFAPVIVSMYLDKNEGVEMFVVSDKTKPLLNYTLSIDLLAWTNGFKPVYSANKQLDIKPLSSIQIDIDDELRKRYNTQNDETEYVIRATLSNSKGLPVSPTAVLLPDKLYKIGTSYYGNAEIASVSKLSSNEYEVSLKASGIVPIVWLDLKAPIKRKYEVLFWFSDNAFVMTQEQVKVVLKIVASNAEFTISKEDISVCHIASC
uniref:Beta-mannosidase n=1 Tax=Acrobeloides nanus TaxID=290746 RepID=A0A914D4I2_9BILA